MFPAGPPLVSSETSPVPLNILATSTPKPTAGILYTLIVLMFTRIENVDKKIN